ncbi:MAG: hypothetical protein DI605_05385 [Sphingomonas sp.]|nr:MAG: hypothetical protein DI605_05385 [Sphingomonas sp.]
MGENTTIEWAHHTFNPWEGCQKCGPGCENCYAETRNARFAGGVAINWGPGAPRRRTSAANWAKPLRWNAEAAAKGIRYRVFCASLADVFDNAVDPQWRDDLWRLILDTPHLDWLLLTKRIGNVGGRTPIMGMPANVWLGITVVNQEEADRDIPKLLATPAARRFLSIEPLLSGIELPRVDFHCDLCGGTGTLARWPKGRCHHCHGRGCIPAISTDPKFGTPATPMRSIDWIIVGGESGPGARPMHPHWARSLRDQCAAAEVPFLFKQWGEWAPISEMSEELVDSCYHPAPAHHPEATRLPRVGRTVLHADGERFDGKRAYEFGAFLQGKRAMSMYAVGKRRSGRLLDGVQHDGVPA